jgi:hypothetical protein
VILWRLFGSSLLYKNTPLMEEYNEEEYAFLMQNGKFLPPPGQREIIQKVCPFALIIGLSSRERGFNEYRAEGWKYTRSVQS